MDNKNTQKAGNNSNQNQFTNCNIIVGITEERAREIIKEEAKNIVASCSFVAQDIARKRTEIFEEHLLPKLVKDELLESFKRPEIMIALRETEKQAMCTDDEESYELLSKLLANRIKYSNDRLIASSLKNATEVATEITDEALSGLTIFFMIGRYTLVTGAINQGLKALNDMFGIVDLLNLPNGVGWLEQLDVLKLVRINSFGKLKKIIDVYSNGLNGYICVGIKKESEQHREAIKILEKVKLNKDSLITHELNSEYVRLPLARLKSFDSVGPYTDKENFITLSLDQQHACEEVIELYERNDTILNKNKERFAQKWDQFPNLKKVKEWWDKIDTSFTMTIVGLVLAYTNINNISKNINLPKIELKDLMK
ncbi:MAG: hypothetical protein IKP66_00880 [Lachnospiraceae bacterium]|nr:hypothetical protein [Lachnospiraceae bacterium]